MLPGGLGVAEGSLTGLLAGLGIPLPEAAAATLLVRADTLWLAVGLGVRSSCSGFPGRRETIPPRSSPSFAAYGRRRRRRPLGSELVEPRGIVHEDLLSRTAGSGAHTSS